MKPGPFRYYAPTELDDVHGLLASFQEEAKLLAGGQSLVPLMNMRLAVPEVIIDVNNLADLAYHDVEPDCLIVGALCRHHDIEADSSLRLRFRALGDAVSSIGNVAVRNRGTVVGSIVHADPAAEWPAISMLLDAEIIAESAQGIRQIAASDFFQGPLSTTLRADEIVTRVRFPLPSDTASAFVEASPRQGDFATVGVGVSLTLTADADIVQGARIAFCGVGVAPVRAPNAEAALIGNVPGDSVYRIAAYEAGEAVKTSGDSWGTMEYRTELIRALVPRALHLASRRAIGRGLE